MRAFAGLDELAACVGEPLVTSGWIEVDQARIDAFAATTEDRQWIHTDPARAAAGPLGGTVAHGFLTLALLPALLMSSLQVADARLVLNYGLNRVRFVAPVPAGSRLRARFRLLACEPLADGLQLTLEAQVEREGGTRPACVAELLLRLQR